LAVGGQTYNLTWTVLDGDGVGLVMRYTGVSAGGSQLVAPSDLTLNSALTFNELFNQGFNGGVGTPGVNSSGPVLVSSGEVNVVPLPAALPLFAGGLGALGALGWRRKRKAAAA
jgi:hypothetical protein